MRLSRTIPSLPVRGIAAAADFYREKLGFEALHVDAGIAVLAEYPVVSGAESFLSGTASCRVEVDDVEALYAEFAPRGILHPTDGGSPIDTGWGTREFSALDLDGNLLTFFQVAAS